MFFREHISLDITYKLMKLSGPLEHITMQGRVSQKREDLGHFFLKDFLYSIKFELRHK